MNNWDEFLKLKKFNNKILDGAQLVKIQIEEESLTLFIELDDLVLPTHLDDFKNTALKYLKIDGAKTYIKIKYRNMNNLTKYEREYYALFFDELKKGGLTYEFIKDYQYNFHAETKTYFIIIDQGSKFVNPILKTLNEKMKAFLPGVKFKTIIDNSLEPLKQKITKEAQIETETGIKKQTLLTQSKEIETKRQTILRKGKTTTSTTVNIKQIPIDLYGLDQYRNTNGVPKFTIAGEISAIEIRTLTRCSLLILTVFDESDAITVKQFLNNDKAINEAKIFKIGDYLQITGEAKNDTFLKEIILECETIKLINKPLKNQRMDNASQKRIELGCHTRMSTLDSITDTETFMAQAEKWGHAAIGFTDTNNIWAFPEIAKATKKYQVKPIYGCEFNLVDNDNFIIAHNVDNWQNEEFVVFDVETTGLSHTYDQLIEIGAVKIKNNRIDPLPFKQLIKCNSPLRKVIINTTNITDAMLAEEGVDIKKALKAFSEYAKDAILVAHNAQFDLGFIRQAMQKYNIPFNNNRYLDTLRLAQYLYHDRLKRFNLKALCKELKVELIEHHRAYNDANATGLCLLKMLAELKARGVTSMQSLYHYEEGYRYLIPNKITMLVKNQQGYTNLFKLVSHGLTDYFYQEARLPKLLVAKLRNGLLIGSSAEEGEIFEAALYGTPEQLAKKIAFYDYIEILPPIGYLHLINELEDNKQKLIQDVIQRIIIAAKQANVRVIATNQPRYLEPEEQKYHQVYVNAKRIGGGISRLARYNQTPNYYFMSTTEMLNAFYFLDNKIAEEIVINNPNYLNSLIEPIKSFSDELYSLSDDAFAESLKIPSIDNALRELISKKLAAKYGTQIDPHINNRVQIELKTIIKNKYAPIYYIAYLLVNKSVSEGYIVGSRGSVGSSFIATLLDITEVNPMPPHYLCPHCQYHYFLKEPTKVLPDEEVLQNNFTNISSGFDLPPATCPKCNHPLKGDGHNIPFETFLGFSGDKIPDIDLNFSGEYQPTAHQYVRELLGEDYTFRAGTIQTVKEKNAYGYLKDYLTNNNIILRRAKINQIIQDKLVGTQRTTSQHPGGIVIVPKNHSILDITPVQFAANNTDSSWKTTHFDYHSFESNLLKLDILGHDDPTMIKFLMTQVAKDPDHYPFKSAFDIPLNDPDVYSLFSGLTALNIKADQLGTPLGTLGIPEFGTEFVRQMLHDTKPQCFSDFVKISGLSHGEGIWLKNADQLVSGQSSYGKIPFGAIIGCRDDIMLILINQYQCDPLTAFNIMEFIRKNKITSNPSQWLEYESYLKQKNIPAWFIDSARKIKYLFPKAHACAYVIMALRIGWFKVHAPLLYYAAYFTKRAKQFDHETMIKGADAIKAKLVALYNTKDKSATQKDLIVSLEIAHEMTLRGFSFYPVNIKTSAASDFLVEKKGLRMPFVSLDALGETVANEIVKQREIRMYTSLDDIINRSKINKTVLNYMIKNNLLTEFKAGNNPLDITEEENGGLVSLFDMQ